MTRLFGLLAFSLGLCLFVFARTVARAIGERLDRPTGHRTTVATRGVGAASMLVGFVVVVV